MSTSPRFLQAVARGANVDGGLAVVYKAPTACLLRSQVIEWYPIMIIMIVITVIKIQIITVIIIVRIIMRVMK